MATGRGRDRVRQINRLRQTQSDKRQVEKWILEERQTDIQTNRQTETDRPGGGGGQREEGGGRGRESWS